MLYKKSVKIVLGLVILISQSFDFQVSANVINKLIPSASKGFKDYHVNDAVMCEWYFSHPDLFEKVLFSRVELIELKIKKFIGNLNKIKSNRKVDTSEFQGNIHRESQKLEIGIEILSSMNGRKPISDYSILISRLGIMFDNLKKIMCCLNDNKDNRQIKNEVEKLHNDFYHLLFDPIAYTIRYIAR